MNTLNEIIDFMLSPDHRTESVNYELVAPYKNMLYVYFKNYFGCEPILLVTDIFNACTYCRIVPSNELEDAVCSYLEVDYIEEGDSYIVDRYDTIMFSSTFLKNIL